MKRGSGGKAKARDGDTSPGKTSPSETSGMASSGRWESVKADLAGRELDILRWIGIAWPPARRQTHIHCPFPGHDDKNPSWRWDTRKKAWFCSQCGGGDILHAVERMKGLSFQKALDLIETELLGRAYEAPKPERKTRRISQQQPAERALQNRAEAEAFGDLPKALDESADAATGGPTGRPVLDAADDDIERRRQRAFQLWSEAKAVAGTLAQTYFEQHRGIVLDWPLLHTAIRFHSRLWCSERDGYYPAILFRVSDAYDGELKTLHRLYLGEDGGKAKIASPKKAYGEYAGGAIWFGAPQEGGELVKAEGPENALVCFMAGRPFVASAISGANLKNVVPPSIIKTVLVAGDRGRGVGKGKAGEDYAEDAANADRKRKVSAAITYPPARPKPDGKWQDWNDLLVSDGLDAVREALAQSEPWEDLPFGFRWQENGRGLEFLSRIVKGEDGEEEDEWDWLCSEVRFLATTLNADSKDWGLYLEIRTRNAVWHKAAIPKTDLVTSSEDIFKHLAFHGLDFNITPRAKTKLRELLVRTRPKSYALCVPKVGFHDGVFVLPDETIGESKGRAVVFQPHKPVEHFYRKGGSLKGWQDGVAAYARGNDRLMFAIAAALAPPLLEPIGMEGGGIHFRGGSTAGKTTILRAAGTVWGGGGQYGFMRTWRATDNALEAVAAIHNNAFLALDEIAEIEPRALFRAAYALANGRQKERMQRTSDLRSACTWRLLFMSTGEIGMAEKLSEDRMRATGGQAVRLVEISADAGHGMGMFQTLHGFKEPKQLAEALNASGREHYGHAAPAFIRHLTGDLERLTEGAKAFIGRFVQQACAKDADGQVARVAGRFGLIAAAGELAIAAGIVPWRRGEVREACKRLFLEWLAARGTSGPIETQNGILQVKGFIELHGSSRFSSWHTPGQPTLNRVGFYRIFDQGADDEKVVYYVLPEGWKEICRGHDARSIASAMVKRGIINPDNDGKYQRVVRLPGMGPRRCYEIDASLLFGDEDEPSAQFNGSAWVPVGPDFTATDQ
ncbi:protein of unknown function DUF927 [Rhodomicrobium vannielii ATCC 17100]|uniref:Zinc finger CHC2-type domain-containing protein n=1 Tax=Rhodomicrobium vannielii (strain ATCC 17100 / DSM 162 / LMG 4299 / NCIMB 10020 / ATH 3.1.1) TaxID=648757 RepID=E3I331_RHOVT|nr:DUF927 domain-containing protein [Rhodomicrobium vannielii]ADP70325.1 protein of unknown function DUF927 [Rhodomicrobium vannielii ATCC 17100]